MTLSPSATLFRPLPPSATLLSPSATLLSPSFTLYHPLSPSFTLCHRYIFGGQGFLQGKSQAVGSYYPVLNLVDEFKETPVQTSRMAAATGRSLPALAAALCVLAALRVWRL